MKEVEDETIHKTFIFTGMRRGEMLGLKWSDVDFQKAKIHISCYLARAVKKGLFLKDVKLKVLVDIYPFHLIWLKTFSAIKKNKKDTENF